ncbi:MAG: MoaD/ThiS family protein [Chloroflexota bacterium]
MKVILRLFASYRELAGTGRIELDLPQGTDISGLLRTVRRDFSSFPDAPVHVAVNTEFVASGYELHEGDEIALLPPVSGG